MPTCLCNYRLKTVSMAGEVLDIFLRITSEKMFQTYGDRFLKLLDCFQRQLLPLLPAKATGTLRLESFLADAIQFKGRVFPAIFEED